MLNLYQYHTDPQSLYGAPIDPIPVGAYNGKQYFLAPVICDKKSSWNDAMEYCKSLSIGGYDDWYLPTKDELTFIYQNKSNKLMLADAYYWSSSEESASLATLLYMSNGFQGSYNKVYDCRHRAIRST
jgi:hypothetical protein